MNNPENTQLTQIATEQQPTLLKARDTLMKLSHDPEMRYLWLMKEKEERDKLSSLNYATRKGVEQGRAEEKLEMARKMLASLPNETISEFTGLDIATIQKLRN